MGRKNTKKPGALVKLYRRRKPGLGLIVEVRDTDQIRQFARGKFKIRFKAIHKIRDKIGYNKLHEYRRKGTITEDQKKMIESLFMYGKEETNRRLALVRWITQPSAWETKTTTAKADWYPLEMLRTVSEVRP